MLAKHKSATSEFDLAKVRWLEKFEARNAKITEVNARRVGLSLARNADDADQSRCETARKVAGPFRRLAERRPEEAGRQLRDLEFEIEEGEAQFMAESDVWHAARRTESNRIAQELAPRHRTAIADIARAFEKLSAAIQSERAVRAEFAKLAPEPESRFLPPMSPPLGTLSEWSSTPATWARHARKLGFF